MSGELTLAEIATAAGVTRAAVSNWRRRHDDFPSPGPEGAFDPVAVARWLDRRKVAADELREDEVAGATYGARFRRNAAVPEAALPAEAVWKAADVLRGHVQPSAMGDVVLGLIAVKARDPEALRSHDLSGLTYTYPDLFTPTARATIKGLEPRSLEDIATVIDQAAVLPTQSAEVFQNVLTHLMEAGGAKSGEFFTPRTVASLMVRLLDPEVDDTILDPSCGTGGLLVAAAEHVIHKGGSPDRIALHGNAIADETMRIAAMNLSLLGVEPRLDQSAYDNLERGVPSTRAAVVLSNPPFNLTRWTDSPVWGSWPFGPPPLHNANFAWLQLAVSALEPSGRAAVVMPNGAAFSERAQEREIRAAMVKAGAVSAIVALPPRLFATTNIPVMLWILKPPRSGADPKVLFVDATDHATSVGRNRNTLDDGVIERIVDTVDLWHRESRVDEPADFAVDVSAELLEQEGYRLNPRMWVKAPSPADRSTFGLDDLRDDLEAADNATVEADRLAGDATDDLLTMAGDATGPSRTVPLSDVCEIVSGWAHSPNEGTAVPVVSPKDLRYGRIVGGTAVTVAASGEVDLARYRLQAGDLVLARTGDVGRVALADASNSGWVINRSCIRLRPDPAVDPYYLMSYLSHPEVVDWIGRRASSSTIPSLSVNVLAGLPVALPPIEVQRRVALAMQRLDEKARHHNLVVQATNELRAKLLPLVIDGPAT